MTGDRLAPPVEDAGAAQGGVTVSATSIEATTAAA